jgi:phospholipase/carboxylesterase
MHRSPKSAIGRLAARPATPRQEGTPGLHRLRLKAGWEAALFVPERYRAGRPAPLVVMLHGSGGDARQGISLFREAAETAGALLLAPKSRHISWDVIQGGYGPDVASLDQALEQVFAGWAVDPKHLAVGGFSDGASYALSLGITNGDLFTHVIAFSPGFVTPAFQPDSPRIYIAHGKDDRVLPIAACSRRLVPALRRAGYDVTYTEFEGGHAVPPEVAQTAARWLIAAE